MEQVDNKLGVLLRRLRGKRTLRDVAKETGLSHSYISDLERNVNRKTKNPVKPSPETLQKLAQAYKHPYKELMREAGYIDDDSSEIFEALRNDPRYTPEKEALIRDILQLNSDRIDDAISLIQSALNIIKNK